MTCVSNRVEDQIAGQDLGLFICFPSLQLGKRARLVSFPDFASISSDQKHLGDDEETPRVEARLLDSLGLS